MVYSNRSATGLKISKHRNIQKVHANSLATYYRGLVIIYFGTVFSIYQKILFSQVQHLNFRKKNKLL